MRAFSKYEPLGGVYFLKVIVGTTVSNESYDFKEGRRRILQRYELTIAKHDIDAFIKDLKRLNYEEVPAYEGRRYREDCTVS